MPARLCRSVATSLLTIFLVQGATSAGPEAIGITVLPPVGSFPVPGDSSLGIREAKSFDDSLWFLLAGGQLTSFAQVDSTGHTMKITSVTAASIPDHFCIDGSKRAVAVQYWNRTITAYNLDGSVAESGPARHSFGCAYLAHQLVSINRDGFVGVVHPLAPEVAAKAPGALAWPSLILQSASESFIVLDQADAVMSIFNGAANKWSVNALVAPEIQGVTREPRTETGAMPSIIRLAVDRRSGDLFALTSPYSVYQGAPVLRFNAQEISKRDTAALSTAGRTWSFD